MHNCAQLYSNMHMYEIFEMLLKLCKTHSLTQFYNSLVRGPSRCKFSS